MATDVVPAVLPEGVYSDGSRLWRAKRGATSTFEENVAARKLFLDLHADEFWNPGRMEEQAADLERAERIMQEWQRAEPGFRRKTKRQLDAEMARWERDLDQNRLKREQERQLNLRHYDPERDKSRLALLEHQCVLAHVTRELVRMHSGEAFPRMDPKRRAEQVAELEASAARHQAAVEKLAPTVGDPEDVVDRTGHLPRDRRLCSLYWYRERRIAQVRKLRGQLAGVETQLEAAGDRSLRSKLRAERDVTKCRLDKLLAVPRLEAVDMCADCPTPATGHGYVTPPYGGPCPAWPAWGARLKKAREMLEDMAKSVDAGKAAETPRQPQPGPLAVIPSGLPIAQVVQRLQEVQQRYPAPEVRRGRANRWEVWPSDAQS